MTMFNTILFASLSFILTASIASTEIGWITIAVPEKAPEFWQIPLYCASDLDLRYQIPNFTLKWYKDGEEFYRYTTRNKKDPIQVFAVEGVRVNKLFSEKKEVLLEDISKSSAGMYRCEITTEAPDSMTKFEEKRMDVQPSVGDERYTCMPEVFNERHSLKIACYFLVNGTNTAHAPWNFNWYKDDRLIYSHTPEKIRSPRVSGVFLDSQLTHKNYIVLHHANNKTNGKYILEISQNQQGSTEDYNKYKYGINVDYF